MLQYRGTQGALDKAPLLNVRESITSWLRNGVAISDPNRIFFSDTALELSKAFANRGKDNRVVTEADLVDAFKAAIGNARRKPEGEALVTAYKRLHNAVFRTQAPDSLVEYLVNPPEHARER